MKMPIYKAREQSNYAQIPNSTAQDNRLSFEARGMLVMLLSMPEDWAVSKEWLVKQTSAGRDKVQRMINELVQCGYMRKCQPKNQYGQFTSNDFFVYSSAVDGLAVDGLAVDGKTTTTKETSLQNKQDYKDKPASQVGIVREVIDLYHRLLPEMPKCEKITEPRKKSILKRHKEDFNGKIENWDGYFTYVRNNCSWVLNPRDGGKKNNIDLLIKESFVVKTMEGVYDDR